MKCLVVRACVLIGLIHPGIALPATPSIGTPLSSGMAKASVIYEQRKLTAADGRSPDRFGHALDVSGRFALIGTAPDDVPADRPEREAAYVFERVGDQWIERRRLAPANDGQVRSFGRAVAIDGDTAVVGAPREAGPNGASAGAVHVYVRNGSDWTLQARLVAPDGGGNDRFGAAVAAEGNVIVVGAPWAQVETAGGAGAAYVFVRQGASWSSTARLVAPAGFSGDEFGFAVAVSGDAVLIGAPDAGPQNASQNGLAYVFTRQGGGWNVEQTLVAPDAANGSLFGHAVALDDDRALIGAYAANGNALRSGAAYVFRRDAERWAFEQALAPGSGQQGASLGDSVALDSHQALIGAPGDAFQSGNSRGSAYAYLRAGQRWGLQSRLLPVAGSVLDFGDVVLGSTAERTMSLQNSAAVGAMPLQITECTISGGNGFSVRQPGFPATIVASGALPLQIEFRSQRYTAAPRTAVLRCTAESAGAVVVAEWPLRIRVLPEIFASGFGD